MERVPQDLVDGVPGLGVEPAQSLDEPGGRDGTHLFDHERGRPVQTVFGVGLDRDVQRQLPHRRRNRSGFGADQRGRLAAAQRRARLGRGAGDAGGDLIRTVVGSVGFETSCLLLTWSFATALRRAR